MKVQNLSDVLAEGPHELLERPLAAYRVLLRQTPEPTREHIEALDYVLRHTVVRLLVRAAGREELEAAYEEIRRLVPVRVEKQIGPWYERWLSFAALLDARLAVLDAQEPERALSYAHADEILELVEAQPGLTQSEICTELKLKPANLSRVLGLLEAHELIERRTVGREKRVFVGRLAPTVNAEAKLNEDAPGPPPAHPHPFGEVERGRTYLFAA